MNVVELIKPNLAVGNDACCIGDFMVAGCFLLQGNYFDPVMLRMPWRFSKAGASRQSLLGSAELVKSRLVKILMASSEMGPLAKTGGLGEVLESLPAQLIQQGHEVSVVIPYYRSIKENKQLKVQSTGVQVSIPVGQKRSNAEILECRREDGLQLFFVRRDEYFDRSAIYGEANQAYDDNAERFIFFDKAVVELARRMNPSPDLIHCHDWTTGLIPVFVRDQKLPFGTVYTIHNLSSQGNFWGVDFGLTNLPGHYFGPRGVEFYGRMNCMKAGILYADQVTTVSQQYAQEIQTPEYGQGLDVVLRENAYKLSGVINGIDNVKWNPAQDKLITSRFSAENPAGKAKCRTSLLKEMKLLKGSAGPVFGMVSRTVVDKGFDLLLPVIDLMMTFDVRLIVMGDGDQAIHQELMILERRHAGKMRYLPDYAEKGAHRINAGCDVMLAPSRFEPFGLSAVHALRYGALGVVRGTGGLFQIIQDHQPGSDAGNGFVFYNETVPGLWDAVYRAIELFPNKTVWSQLMQNAMAADFSWQQSASEYGALYRSVARPAPVAA